MERSLGVERLAERAEGLCPADNPKGPFGFVCVATHNNFPFSPQHASTSSVCGDIQHAVETSNMPWRRPTCRGDVQHAEFTNVKASAHISENVRQKFLL